MKKTILALMLCVAAGAQASPLTAYEATVDLWTARCTRLYSQDTNFELGATCVDFAKVSIHSRYEEALREVQGTAKQDALKGHMLQAKKVIEGTAWVKGEDIDKYDERQISQIAVRKDLWNGFIGKK